MTSRKRSTPPVALTLPMAIREMATAFQRSRALLTAFELGIFTALEGANMSSAQVAAAIRTEERATDRLMNALCSMGFLLKQGGIFSNAPHASMFLVKGKPEYMAGLMHTANLWHTWSTLTQAVRRGTSVATRHADYSADKWRRAFIAAMHDRASKNARFVVEMLDLSRVSRVLDVGGGSGAYSMAFAQAKKGLRATVFDLPDIIPLTKEYVGSEDYVDFVSGDYTVDDLCPCLQDARPKSAKQKNARRAEPCGYDLVFLSAIIHSNSVPENRRLMQNCVRALIPGGQVVIQDFIMDEDRTGPAPAALFALNMLVNTEAGDTYTEAEVGAWMREEGLREIVRKDTQFGTTLMIGKKAG